MVVSAYFREIISTRIPDADFAPYFAFIESLPPLNNGGHRHHILPKKEFPEFAKDSKNIIRLSPADHFRAHYWLAVCAPTFTPFQVVFYQIANRRRSYQVSADELSQYAEVYERGSLKQADSSRKRGYERSKNPEWLDFCSKGGKISGKIRGLIQGRINVESGHLAKLRTPEHQATAARASGLIQGRKNVESGFWASLRTPENLSKAGQAAGRKNVKSGWIFELGRKAVESGQLASITTFETCSKGGRMGGVIAGQKNVESGHIQKLGKKYGRISAENGQLAEALHTRWHTKRAVIKSDCVFCQTTTSANEGQNGH